jgi:peptide/nickel transport system substrate-binding protein
VGITLGGQWSTKPTYDPTVPWALPDQEKAKKVRLALNLALDKQAVIDAALGGLGTPSVAVGFFFQDKPWTPADLKPFPYDPAQARKLMAEAGYPNCFEFTMNLVAWPGRAYLPLVGEAVATQWEANLGCKIKRRPLDRAVFTNDFNKRTYPGVAVAYSFPFLGGEPWQLWRVIGDSKGSVMLSYEDPQMDAFLGKVGATADFNERVKIMQDMARYLYDKVPRVEIAETFGLFGVSDKVKTWALTPGNGSLHNLDYVNLVWAPPGQPVVLAK